MRRRPAYTDLAVAVLALDDAVFQHNRDNDAAEPVKAACEGESGC